MEGYRYMPEIGARPVARVEHCRELERSLVSLRLHDGRLAKPSSRRASAAASSSLKVIAVKVEVVTQAPLARRATSGWGQENRDPKLERCGAFQEGRSRVRDGQTKPRGAGTEIVRSGSRLPGICVEREELRFYYV